MQKSSILTRTIWILSLVSLFTDVASEMLYPVMPVYLKSIGYSILIIGILEGFAEAVAGLSKIYFGRISDLSQKRLPFVQLGYLLSAISKPMLAVSTQVWWVFQSRFIDRLGKGIRTAPRDALLSSETTPENKGTVFGFHRALDTTGAVIGPLGALLYLYYFPGDYKNLFLIAFVPGIIAIVFTFFIKEKRTVEKRKAIPIRNAFSYWKVASPTYKKWVLALFLFALVDSSDVFLLLKMKEAGLSDTGVIAAYIFYNLVFAALAYPLGRLADKIGLKTIFVTGLFLFAITYAGFGLNSWWPGYWILFFCYGAYAAGTEGISKAWISNMVPAGETASALGFYTGYNSILKLVASSLAGLIWYQWGAVYVFLFAACIAACVATWFLVYFRKN